MVPGKILVTGATGYVGGQLASALLQEGRSVRVLTRCPSRLDGRSFLPSVDVVQGDVLRPDTIAPALDGIQTAYYLVHSMAGGRASNFEELDLKAARNFGEAASDAGVRHLVYLGGLGRPGSSLSAHLRSRQATGDALREAGVPVTEFRAAVIVGAGSISFEMVRNLSERIPVMICPKWVYTKTQPIAIDDVLAYLLACLREPQSRGRVIEIGGQDVMTYADMIHIYAEARGLRRLLIPVPLLTPRLSSYWVHWTTPVTAQMAGPLIEGLRSEVIVRDDISARLFPTIQPMDYRAAVKTALKQLSPEAFMDAGGDAKANGTPDPRQVHSFLERGMILERHQCEVNASEPDVYRVFTSFGGRRGWPAFDWAWRLRGILDRLVGGEGMGPGRPTRQELEVGDALDFWRVEVVEKDRFLRLKADLKIPGEAWLQFEVAAETPAKSFLVQTAIFAPKGVWGLAYWWTLLPFHRLIFSNMVKRIAEIAER